MAAPLTPDQAFQKTSVLAQMAAQLESAERMGGQIAVNPIEYVNRAVRIWNATAGIVAAQVQQEAAAAPAP